MRTRTEIVSTTQTSATWRDYFQLCKPRVVLLMLLTAIVGMCLASPGIVSWRVFLFGNLGIVLAASSAAAINHLLEHHLDKLMRRTYRRPIVQGKINRKNAAIFAAILCILSMIILIAFVNLLTALLTFITLIGYAGFYTLYLKHATPQNIVIGGLAGAAPPLLGWVAVTGHIDPPALILLLIIFLWTPPHFWALAIHRIDDYAKANIPMLPNTHGIIYTKINILLYTLLLTAISFLPFVIMTSGWIYFSSVCLLNLGFLYWAIRLLTSQRKEIPMRTFQYSIWYLMLLFTALLVDHYVYLALKLY
ncbi:protoheme IX farnesyltransferase [Coxiella burnetii]|uniref:heme o synthase n=2 Tax=Coxiella burnetii TaxID=777 RepID=UPI000312C12C|nr:heme o synthase [Coxiella burnetii]AML49283.1 protoheme IX farnesyltransferase [Coxiella burnetii]ATN69196.1 protoheme IX farnesyltransferase [Coxiella burnetii]ATN73024.1 protoheme IX farnesyltransferase [Coxiella burnetii]AZV75896.1 protoheme IX farnesyltransferase [Coxiella burnetii]KJY15188.1 protoheme IX farnesyltransferase [Coxiella burnetii]